MINKSVFASILFDLATHSHWELVFTLKKASEAVLIRSLREGLEVPLEEGSNLSGVGLPIFLWALKMFALFP